MECGSCNVLGVGRETRFSPGKVREDAAILEAVLAELSSGESIPLASPESLADLPRRPDWVLSMAQSPDALEILERWEKAGTRVFNSSASVRTCYRKPLIACLKRAGVPIPASSILPLRDVSACFTFASSGRYWIKRGDVHAMQLADVVEVASPDEVSRALAHFHRQGVGEVLVQEHVEGEVFKFYGVGDGDYFCAFSCATGNEVSKGSEQMAALARRAATAAGLEIYGGDIVLSGEGPAVLVDLNDWPSFSRCRLAAAARIARYVNRVYRGGFDELPGSHRGSFPNGFSPAL